MFDFGRLAAATSINRKRGLLDYRSKFGVILVPAGDGAGFGCLLRVIDVFSRDCLSAEPRGHCIQIDGRAGQQGNALKGLQSPLSSHNFFGARSRSPR